MAGGVFISYRAEDSHSYGALLYLELSRQFGTELVFLDGESIPAGADFVAHILTRVRRARALLVIIGPRWLTATDAGGRRRIDDPRDWIHRELAEAFAAGTTVIPVLTDGAAMPDESDLPDGIARLARHQYRRLRHRDARADLARLTADLTAADPDLAAAARRPPAPPGPATVATILLRLLRSAGAAARLGPTGRDPHHQVRHQVR
jgi:hypothetical protein